MLTLRSRIENKHRGKPILMQKLQMNQDKISTLPDEILHLILSFLSPREVVRSSLLSKRWKKLWISVPYLYFQYDESTFTLESFKNFVDNFLHYREDSIISEFLVSCKNVGNNYNNSLIDASYVNEWISAAVSGRVQKLQLILNRKHARNLTRKLNLPNCLFTCNSLVTLKLDMGPGSFLVPEFFCFPNMKSIDLSYAIVAKNFSHQLLKSPNLENLVLHDFEFDRKSSPCIQAIEAIFTRLKEAVIGFSANVRGSKNEKLLFSISGDGFSKFLRKLSNVKLLNLDFSCMKILRLERNLSSYHLPSFCNLNSLKVVLTEEVEDVEVVAGLLRCSPILQSLHIIFYYTRLSWTDYPSEQQLPSLIVPSSLKWIQLDRFDGKKYQYELLRYFLGNAQGLEKITVDVYKDDRLLTFEVNKYAHEIRSSMLREKLFGLVRSSTNCVLVIK